MAGEKKESICLEGVCLEINFSKEKAFKFNRELKQNCFCLTFPVVDLTKLRAALRAFWPKRRQKKVKKIVFLVEKSESSQALRLALKVTAQEIFRFLKKTGNNNLKKIVFFAARQTDYRALKENIAEYLSHIKKNKGPFLTVDGLIFYRGGLVLVKRKNPPLGWALPGGFVDYGEKLEKAVCREVKEETNLSFEKISQFKAYSESERDPRFHTVSVVFLGKGKGVLKAGSDAAGAKVFKLNPDSKAGGLPDKIAFDHRKIIDDFLKQKGNLLV